ncbi:GGDEF domain-containing protein [Clostridium aminobutyricum]|uniref:GGDEF domain-containing protein n=1 Tax=Clostridium aminobutyricum TaxID=33953 RepID=A0A939D6Z7_CLOAM|nr:GGDEF domain-containing protein [Clostridium aminobutyricum]MBN7772579.1 GGDEF domain-containing protein [Clostridium aminobutyricum]
MFAMKQMNDLLKTFCSADKLFDSYQLVEPQTHEVFDYDSNDNLIKTEKYCYTTCGRFVPCENCTSKRTCNDQNQYMKLEYVNDRVLLFLSRPVRVENKLFSLELIKNVTDSLSIPSYYHTEKRDVEKVIQQLNDLSIHDAFTGMYNKVYIKNEIDNFVQQMEKTDDKLIGIAIDIDDYTQVNMMYGHGVGNQVLYYIASAVKQVAGLYRGWTGRLGPDEFGLFFKNMSMSEIETICIKLDEMISQHLFEAKGKEFKMTFSYGVAELEQTEDADDYIDRLYFRLRAAQGSKKEADQE